MTQLSSSRSRLLSFLVLSFVLTQALAYSINPRQNVTAQKHGGGGDDGGDDDNGGGNATIPTKANAKNPKCAVWYDVRDAIMGEIYHGRCTDDSRAAVRLSFHDAGTFSKALQASGKPNGGPDGSILKDPNEVNRAENNGLQTIASKLRPLPARFGVTNGDVAQLAGVLGVLSCPGGPQIKTYIGRPEAQNVAPDGLLPDVHAQVSNLTARFADMGFDTRELMALIGAHTCARQRFVDLSKANSTLDSTVSIWDVNFYRETQSSTTAQGVFKLPSDVLFSHDSQTQKDYNRFVGKQDNWAQEYANAHEKMSLLGQNQNSLTDCTEILPQSIDLKDLAPSNSKGGGNQDPVVDPAKLEAAIQKYRSIWLN